MRCNHDAQRILDSIDMPNKEMRSMFGGMTFFSNGFPFAAYWNGHLYLRVSQEEKHQLDAKGIEPLTYRKENSKGWHSVKSRYYPISAELLNNTDALLAASKQACEQARQEKENTIAQTRIKDMPNMRLSIERMLKKVGIHTKKDLINVGSKQAFALLESEYSEVSVNLYFKIEGAISGKHYLIVKEEQQYKSRAAA
ncbi:TfoX/Sxy family DNA transformation protein [Vibrio sp. TRT 29B02]|uniref:TfoX/Sxy family DNA transformation protein n=1 Tax=Vibrio sp. TRT 29B02 TaxID=3418508 RepID=UPI003CF5A89F